jgi:L-fuconolactonase
VPDLPIVDSHIHLWDPRRFRMPWLDGNAQLNRPFGLSDFLEAADGLQMTGMVYVQVDVTPAYGLMEAEWVAQLDERVAGTVAWAPVEDGAPLRTYVNRLITTNPRLKGVRRLLQSESDPDFLIAPDFLTGLQMLPEYSLSFDICIRHDQLGRTIDMVRACPNTVFVLDHVGKPDIRNRRLDEWRDQISELAGFLNVNCKISGLVTEADLTSWTPDDLEPYVSHAVRAFGEDRVLFGGDWPVVTMASAYVRWVDALDQLTRGLSLTAKRKLWADNARRVYRL